MKELKYVGKSLVREDSYDKATGKTIYVGDMKRTDMLYAKLVLSEKAHADIEIDRSEAMLVEGIEAIYTHEDVPKVFYNSAEWYPGIKGIRDELILNNRARFVGDRIALVVGSSKETVEKAISKLKIIYKELKPVIGLKQARKDEVIIKENTNLAFSKSINVGNYEEALKKADYVIKDIGTTPKVHHAAIEPHVCLAEFDYQGNLVICTPCQVATQVQMHVANVLNIPLNKVRTVKAVMGGSFGGKSQPILEPIVAFAAWKLNRAVLLYMDRTDVITGTVSRNATEIAVETAVNKEGKILGRKVEVRVDGGAYNTNASNVTMALGKKLYRLYDIPNQTFEGKAYYTNTLPGGTCRGYGSPQGHAVTEVNIDNIAKKLNMDPCEFRLLNLVDEGAKDLTGAPEIGNAKIKECVKVGMEAFNWKEKRDTIKNKSADRYAYGVGMACGTHGNGYKGAYPDFTNVDMRIYADEGAIVKIGVHDLGCGTITTLKQIAAETLDINMEKIRITEADTFVTPYDSAGTQASRVTYVCGGAIKEAGKKLKAKLINAFCKLKNVPIENVETANGYIYDKNSTEEHTYGDIVTEYEKHFSESMSISLEYKSPANPASFAAFFAEVKVDKYTGLVDVIDCLAVHDIGRAINPMLVEGQIQGGAQFGLGMALYEQMKINKNGDVKSNSFSKYHIINSTSMPKVKIILIEDNEPYGPYGAKSVGEMATVAPAPAIINAINFALDTNITTFPATPEVIVNEILKKGI
ncbi:molybdopterin-dependent oxidoreductase [Schnuerera sp. xch1]|uniref:xanthine dehydrogenase family protein molybdopterin-binding subunit n=1 Tax=Schnuerera sp. xch1 TaxID=2874283 RepID=UPI001CBB4892|nr:molybdopterin cofactor-binding domain-containing protein [Schnuerera sp. xch1]MBZ2175170.1 molybdopterin-dependent oxidoreductase [Schnuerera sp. xch1]